MTVADFSLENEVETRVDRFGASKTTRRWAITNLRHSELDLSRWRLFADLTNFHAHPIAGCDSRNQKFDPRTEDPGEGYLRVGCNIDAVLEAGETYRVELEYEESNYFLHLPKANCWVVDEWFYRSPYEGPYVQQEPEPWCFKLHIADARWSFLGIRNPTQSFHVETCLPVKLLRNRAGVSFSWPINLRPGERSEKMYVLCMLRSRLDLARLLNVARLVFPF